MPISQVLWGAFKYTSAAAWRVKVLRRLVQIVGLAMAGRRAHSRKKGGVVDRMRGLIASTPLPDGGSLLLWFRAALCEVQRTVAVCFMASSFGPTSEIALRLPSKPKTLFLL